MTVVEVSPSLTRSSSFFLAASRFRPVRFVGGFGRSVSDVKNVEDLDRPIA